MRFVSFCVMALSALTLTLAPAQSSVVATQSLNVAVTDVGTPTTFSFSSPKPVGPLTGMFLSELTISATLTDANGNRSDISALQASFSALAQATIDGIGVYDLGPDAVLGGPYGPFQTSMIVDSASFGGTIEMIGVALAFLGSGNDDQFFFTLTHTLSTLTVPEAQTLALAGLGLAGVAAAGRRRAVAT
jgi:hypothetical protein